MRAKSLLIASLLSLSALASSCALDDGAGHLGGNDHSTVVEQPVFLQPVFELEGLDQLPAGMHLDELHLGVGALFLDLLDSSDGIAYANRTPFRLNFYIAEGRITAVAPSMTLPQGGRYLISLQIEPQEGLTEVADPTRLDLLEDVEGEASLVLIGRVAESRITPNDGDDSEPAPLPWHPTEVDGVDSLRRSSNLIPFSYTSRRTVRFVLDEVELIGGSETELVMQLQVGDWGEETISPAVYEALDQIDDGNVSTDRLEGVEVDLGDRIDTGNNDGMDGLIGGIEIEIR